MSRTTEIQKRTSPMKQEKDTIERSAECTKEILDDLRLAAEVEHALSATGYAALRAVEVRVADRVVTLQGGVPTYYMKQQAQAVALGVAEGLEVRNDLEVVRSK